MKRVLGHRLGLHRVKGDGALLPQAAVVLDASLPLYTNEILIEVDTLNIDSASFRQIREQCLDDPVQIKQHITQLVTQRGKMHNPVTGSGGMLAGKVSQIGEHYQGPLKLKVGDQVASLVSLTLTPLVLSSIGDINLGTGQLKVKGHAILFESSIAAKLPSDFSAALAIAILDVCGAPALVKRHTHAANEVLIIGAGKSGILSAFAALDQLGESDKITLVDIDPHKRDLICGFGFNFVCASHAILLMEQLSDKKFDLVINASNAPDTEMAALLNVKSRGKVIFFNMATNFAKAVLGAEGLAIDADLLMGVGYSQGHADYVFDLMRNYALLRQYFEKMYADAI